MLVNYEANLRPFRSMRELQGHLYFLSLGRRALGTNTLSIVLERTGISHLRTTSCERRAHSAHAFTQ